jgi:acyl-CoA dehydrogenase
MVSFEQNELESAIRSGVSDLMENYDDDYWREIRDTKRFPNEVWQDLADNGWVGVTIPEEYGGQGLGVQEAVTVIDEVGTNGGWWITNNLARTPVFLAKELEKFASEGMKEEWLPQIAAGDVQFAMAVTEPEAGLNTTAIDTFAEKDGDEYVINGSKIWISGVDEAERIIVLTRTTRLEDASKKSKGLSIFLVDPDDPGVEYEEIPSELSFNDRTYNVYFDDLRVHESKLLGNEDEGLYHIFDSLNVERVTIAAHTLALGKSALNMAVDYANEREVFDAPIGSHQAIQHPLADAYADLETAELLVRKGAWMYDNDEDMGSVANLCKLKAGDASWNASEAAMTTYGGMSASKDLGIATIWQIVRHLRTIPISEEMIYNYLGEHTLGLPRSY